MLSTNAYRPYSLADSCRIKNAPSASVATALAARHAIVQPTSPVVRSASPAVVASLGVSAMDSRDYRWVPATMPGDVPVGGPRRSGPPSVFGFEADRWPPASR